MLRAALPWVLALLCVAPGCRSWNVSAFGMAVGEKSHYATVDRSPAPAPRKLGHHAELTLDGLSKDERTGVYVTVGVAIAAIIAFLIVS